jgi:hypothetical protein
MFTESGLGEEGDLVKVCVKRWGSSGRASTASQCFSFGNYVIQFFNRIGRGSLTDAFALESLRNVGMLGQEKTDDYSILSNAQFARTPGPFSKFPEVKGLFTPCPAQSFSSRRYAVVFPRIYDLRIYAHGEFAQ